MPKRNTPYRYQSTDSPLTVANQFNLQPNQLIDANPGGYPFSTGQTINIPTATQFGTSTVGAGIYNTGPSALSQIQSNYNRLRGQNNPSPYATTPPAYSPYGAQPGAQAGTYNGTPNMAQPLGTPQGSQPYSQLATQRPSTPVPFGGVQGGYQGLTPGSAGSFEPIYNRLSTLTPEQAEAELAKLTPSLREAVERTINGGGASGTVTNAAGTGGEEFMNTGFMKENAAKGTPFEKQLRWDPDRKKYVQIGKLIREGRLDPRDKNARLKRKRNRGGGQKPKQAREDPNGRLAGVGLVGFSVGSG